MPSLIPGILTHIYVSRGRIWLGCRSWRCCKEGSSGIDSVYNAVVDLTLTLNFRHLRVWSLQRRTPMVAGDWGAKSVVISTASPLRSSLPLLRRPRRSPMPSSPSYILKKCLLLEFMILICRYGLYICSSVLHFWLTRDPSGRVESGPYRKIKISTSKRGFIS